MKKTTVLSLLVFAGLSVHIVLLLTLKFTAWPEMLLWPYLLIKGYMPYSDIAIAHTPLLILKLAIVFRLLRLNIPKAIIK